MRTSVPRLGVEHGERVVRREAAARRRDGPIALARAATAGATGHEVAERARVERAAESPRAFASKTLTCATGRRRFAPGLEPDRPTWQRASVQDLRERMDAGAPVDAHAGDRDSRARQRDIRSRVRHPDLVRRLAEPDAADLAVEHALHAGRRDSLTRGDHAGVGNVALSELVVERRVLPQLRLR